MKTSKESLVQWQAWSYLTLKMELISTLINLRKKRRKSQETFDYVFNKNNEQYPSILKTKFTVECTRYHCKWPFDYFFPLN